MKIALMAPIAVVVPSCTLANFQNKNEATSAGGGTVLETVHAAGRGTHTVFGNSHFLRRLTGNRWFRAALYGPSAAEEAELREI